MNITQCYVDGIYICIFFSLGVKGDHFWRFRSVCLKSVVKHVLIIILFDFFQGIVRGKLDQLRKCFEVGDLCCFQIYFLLVFVLTSPSFPLLFCFGLFTWWSIIFYLRSNLLQGEIRDLNNLGVWSRHYQIGNVSDFYKKSVVTLAILGCVLVYLCVTTAK